MRILWLFAISMSSILHGGSESGVEAYLSNPYTDHVRVFEKLFTVVRVHSFLEFGMGVGTKYFLDNCDQVVSIELVVKSREKDLDPWLSHCKGLYAGYKNWNPQVMYLSENCNIADIKASKVRYPIPSDCSECLDEINRISERLCAYQKFDVAFVDPGIFFRGDLVRSLFGRVDIILAHDTNRNSRMYGWHRAEDDRYVKISDTHGQGTTVWINKNMPDIICRLKALIEGKS